MDENEAISEVVEPTRRRRHSKDFNGPAPAKTGHGVTLKL